MYLNSIGITVPTAQPPAAQGGAFLSFVQQASLTQLPEHQQRLAFAAATLPQAGPLSEHAALAVFEAMKSLAHEIPYHILTDGCFARAQMMGDAMRLIGLQPAKVWTLPGVDGPNIAGQSWEYHLAPSLQVQTAARVETQGIDPSVATKPENTSNWMTLLGLEHHLFFSSPLTPTGLAAAQAACYLGEQVYLASNGDPALQYYPRGIAVEAPWDASPDGRGGLGFWWQGPWIAPVVQDPIGNLSVLAQDAIKRILGGAGTP